MSLLPQQQGQQGQQQPDDWAAAMNDVVSTYNALSSLSPAISYLIGGSGDVKPNTTTSPLQKMVAYGLVNPHKPIPVSGADLLNPNLLGIQQPKQFGGSAMGAALAGASALPGALRLGSALAGAVGLGGQRSQQQGGPGSGAPSPSITPDMIPQVNIGHGQTMDALNPITGQPYTTDPGVEGMSPADVDEMVYGMHPSYNPDLYYPGYDNLMSW